MFELFDFNDDEPKYRKDTPDDLSILLDKYLTTSNNLPEKLYDVMSSSIGSEYELADISRSTVLPDGLTWDGKDQTVMNSNGVATDPSLDASKRTWDYGGELNTKPCSTIDEIVALYKSLLELCPETTVNNSCNLHNHFRVPGLDLNGLKRVIAYYYVYRDELIMVSDSIPTPLEQGFDPINTPSSVMKLVNDRHMHHTRAFKGTRHSDLAVNTVLWKLQANSLETFHTASLKTASGTNVLDSNATRAAINTWQMRLSTKKEYSHIPYNERPFAESGTIEFRAHHGTTDLVKYRNTLLWDINILNAALNTGVSPKVVFDSVFDNYSNYQDAFPTYIPMNPDLYKIFKLTKNDDSMKRRAIVASNIKHLREDGKF